MNRNFQKNNPSFWLIALFIFAVLPVDTHPQNQERFEFSERKMGTEFRIILYASDSTVAHSAVRAAFKRIDSLNQILSDYEDDSELSKLNETAGQGRAVPVSEPMFSVLQKSLAISKKTDGAFDITVGPMVELWRKSRRTERLPTKEELARVRKVVGYQHVNLNGKNRTVELLKKGMKLNAGGIGKGYAADQVLKVLKGYQFNSVLVDAGGDIVAGDAPPNRQGWKIAIKVDNNGQLVDKVISVSNIAVASSGDLYQYVVIEGMRYSHIVNPRTGLGLTDQSRVSVIASNGTVADSYATALSVLGPIKGLKIIEKMPDAEAIFLRNENGTHVSWNSKGFDQLVNNFAVN